MNDHVFLVNAAGRRLYETAKTLPVVDYHCHLSPKEIYEDRPFVNLAQLWLSGDHYKWRLMRAFGVPEDMITGGAPDREKFQRYAECIALAAGNPLSHWTMMELARYFGIHTPLNGETAEEIWRESCRVLESEKLSPRKLMRNSGVVYVATTDDPADSLEYHRLLAEDAEFSIRVAPSFRTDNLLQIGSPDYPAYLQGLSEAAGFPITGLDSLEEAVRVRLDEFVRCGCRFSDVGIEDFPEGACSREEADAMLRRALAGQPPTKEDARRFLQPLYLFLAGEYQKRDIVMQLHLAVVRNANSALFDRLGPDCGGDCAGDVISQSRLVSLLDGINRNSGLPRTILYTLNPAMYTAMATAAGSFPRVTLGAAWWFNDHKAGIEEQLRVYAQSSHLACFSGMLTDSRSFLSYARHDYFRRIFCNLLGEWLESGEFAGEAAAEELVRRVCYENSLALSGGNP